MLNKFIYFSIFIVLVGCSRPPINTGILPINAELGTPLHVKLQDKLGNLYISPINTAVAFHAVISEDVAVKYNFSVKSISGRSIITDGNKRSAARFAYGDLVFGLIPQGFISIRQPYVIPTESKNIVNLGNDFLSLNRVVLSYPEKAIYFNERSGDDFSKFSNFKFRNSPYEFIQFYIRDKKDREYKATFATQSISECSITEEVAKSNGMIIEEVGNGRIAKGEIAFMFPDGIYRVIVDPRVKKGYDGFEVEFGNNFLYSRAVTIDYRRSKIYLSKE